MGIKNLLSIKWLMRFIFFFVYRVLGVFAISTTGYVSLKYEKGWLERFRIKRTGKTGA